MRAHNKEKKPKHTTRIKWKDSWEKDYRPYYLYSQRTCLWNDQEEDVFIQITVRYFKTKHMDCFIRRV